MKTYGLVGGVGAVLHLVYIGAVQWYNISLGHLPRYINDDVGIIWHLAENIWIVLLVIGIAGTYRYQRDQDSLLQQVGYGLAFAGFATIFFAHFAEHLLPPLQLSLTGDTNLFIWVYYSGWGILTGGFTVLGIAFEDPSVLSRAQRIVTILVFPISVLTSALLWLVIFNSFSWGYKIPVVLVAAFFSYNLLNVERSRVAPGESIRPERPH